MAIIFLGTEAMGTLGKVAFGSLGNEAWCVNIMGTDACSETRSGEIALGTLDKALSKSVWLSIVCNSAGWAHTSILFCDIVSSIVDKMSYIPFWDVVFI